MKRIIVLFLIIAAVLFTSCTASDTAKQNSSLTEDELKRQTSINELKQKLRTFASANNYENTIVYYGEDYINKFSIDIQNEFKDKIIVFCSSIMDITREKDKNYLYLNDYIESERFILQCSDETLNKIKSFNLGVSEFGTFEDLAIIAYINSINRTSFEVVAEDEDEYSHNIKLDDSTMRIFRGECLKVVKLSDLK